MVTHLKKLGKEAQKYNKVRIANFKVSEHLVLIHILHLNKFNLTSFYL